MFNIDMTKKTTTKTMTMQETKANIAKVPRHHYCFQSWCQAGCEVGECSGCWVPGVIDFEFGEDWVRESLGFHKGGSS